MNRLSFISTLGIQDGRTPSFPGARPRSRRSRCGGRKSKFLAVTAVRAVLPEAGAIW